ncbi:hypothetical protein [Ferrovum myxofaciens]|uniref:Uncharacterized protein n=2 Tax=Ferrovum myxofaciens TaxID=416213 RepID=A0A8F3IIY0_9PROT|nr:hypothetical protein [Ferrovum myxofaciens]KXW58751.1 hypothetical protein FEMY_07790 [Ferrovum myxofaciens]QWY73934.1 MAG: hypothetical protein JVY19_08810 [Ferrovum myxofaciens]QWY76687.1 MAG: hypothetical protein JZL65_09265 [Ferrovum myxofaciens]
MKLIEHLKTMKVQEIHLPTSLAFCNPSIVATEEGWWVLVRAIDPVPYQGPQQECLSSENWLLHYADDFTLKSTLKLDDQKIRQTCLSVRNGLEDGRLFLWKGELWGLFSGFHRESESFYNTMIIARIKAGEWVDPVVLPSPHHHAREKNWMPCIRDDELYVFYSTQPLKVYVFSGGELRPVAEKLGVNPKSRIAPIQGSILSGSSQVIPWETGWLAVTHHRRKAPVFKKLFMKHITHDPEYQLKKVLFDHYFLLFDKDFNLIRCSEAFQFEMEGVEFCAGIATKGQRVVLSYGIRDKISRLLETRVDMLNPLIM